MLRDEAAVHNAQVMSGTCSRADVPPFPYLVNGWTDCAEIWYVVRDPLAGRFTEVDDEVQLHVRTCARFLFRICGMAGRIALKFGVWLETHYIVWRFTKVNVGVQVHVRTCAPLFYIPEIAGRIVPKLCVCG